MIFTREQTHQQQNNFEDDASLSSTVVVDRAHKQIWVGRDARATSASPSSGKKSVHFNLADNEEYENHEMSSEDCQDLWYDEYDYAHFRSYTRTMALDIVKTEAKTKAPFSYERVFERAYQVCCAATTEEEDSPLSVADQKQINRWAIFAPNRHGLEKIVVQKISRDRKVRRALQVDTVMDLQDQAWRKDVNLDESIRAESQRVTLPSRLFARCVAESLAAALYPQF
jgi:hypothetical protein